MRYVLLASLLLSACAPIVPDPVTGRCDLTPAMLLGFQPCGNAWKGNRWYNPGPWTD